MTVSLQICRVVILTKHIIHMSRKQTSQFLYCASRAHHSLMDLRARKVYEVTVRISGVNNLAVKMKKINNKHRNIPTFTDFPNLIV